MVESQGNFARPRIDHRRVSGVVAGLRRALGPGDEHRRYRVQPGVSRRIGVGVELAEELDVERGLFAGFPDRGRFERLAVTDEAAGQGPAGRGVLALDEDDAPSIPSVHDLDDDIDGGHGVSEFLTAHLAARPVKAIVWTCSASVNEAPRWSSSSAAIYRAGTRSTFLRSGYSRRRRLQRARERGHVLKGGQRPFRACPHLKTLSERGDVVTG
jgi:hypothetical protein